MHKIIKIEYNGSIPSVNHIWKISKNGIIYKTKDGKIFIQTIAELVQVEMLSKRIKTIKGRVVVYIRYYYTGRGKDIDNILKGILDGLQMGKAFENDSQVVELNILKKKSDNKKIEKLYITVQEDVNGVV